MKYDVKAQCVVVVNDGKAAVHKRPGSTVELDDEQAAPLVAAGKLVAVKAEEPAKVDDAAADDEKPRRRPKPSDNE